MTGKMDNSNTLFTTPTLCVLTNACTPFSTSLALSIGTRLPPQSCLLLIDNQMRKLESLRTELANKCPLIHVALCQSLNLATATNAECEQMFTYSFLGAQLGTFKNTMLVFDSSHCADMAKMTNSFSDMQDPRLLRQVTAVNVTGPMTFTSVFLNKCNSIGNKFMVIVDAEAETGPECMVKSARQTFARCLSDEHTAVRVLNYTISKLATVTNGSATTHHTLHVGLAEGLVKLLNRNQFESGSLIHISSSGLGNYVIDYATCSRPAGIKNIAKLANSSH